MKATVKWKEKDGSEFGPYEGDGELIISALGKSFYYFVEVETMGVLHHSLFKLDEMQLGFNALCLSMDPCSLDKEPSCDKDVIKANKTEIKIYGKDDSFILRFFDHQSENGLDWILINMCVSPNKARQIRSAATKALKFMESHNGYIHPLDISEEDHKRYGKLLDNSKIISEYLLSLSESQTKEIMSRGGF